MMQTQTNTLATNCELVIQATWEQQRWETFWVPFERLKKWCNDAEHSCGQGEYMCIWYGIIKQSLGSKIISTFGNKPRIDYIFFQRFG